MVYLTTSLTQLHFVVWLGDLVKRSLIHGQLSKSNHQTSVSARRLKLPVSIHEAYQAYYTVTNFASSKIQPILCVIGAHVATSKL